MANEEQLKILRQGVEVWNKWRKENPDDEIDLSNEHLYIAQKISKTIQVAEILPGNWPGIDFSGADLSDADLQDADLSYSNLRTAILHRTKLDYINLSNADMRSADLGFTYVRGANLNGTDLTEANLWGTSFSNCSMKHSKLAQARLLGTSFSNVDLSSVQGLDSIDHTGPSYIDISTLYKSQGKIPEVFLRGCGVPDEFITYIPSLTGKPIEFYSCFISYSHQDKAFARRVHDTLQGRGIRCWLDEKQMNPGDDIYREVERGIRYWDKVLLCASQHSLTSWWVDNELDTLFEKERGLMRERGDKVLALIPLDLDGFLFTGDCKNPKKQQIKSRLAADFKGWEHDNALFEREIERVIKALRTDGGKEIPPPSQL